MSEPSPRPASPTDADLELLIHRISEQQSFDIRGYKRSTLYRRLRKRMGDAGCETVAQYLARLDGDAEELARLFGALLIHVTEFFRDPAAWGYLQSCLEPLVERATAAQPLRAWSAGCATGEEAFSLAICLADLQNRQAPANVKIFATDVDEPALATARAAVYPADQLRNVDARRLGRYFERLTGDRYAIRREIRSSVIFGRHNVQTDPPISRLDLLVCRNLLIYLGQAAQQQVLSRFHYALKEDGYLFLGKAETLMTRCALFQVVEPRFRIFRRVAEAKREDAWT